MKKLLLLVAISSGAAYGMFSDEFERMCLEAIFPGVSRMAPDEIICRKESTKGILEFMEKFGCNCGSISYEMSVVNSIQHLQCSNCGLVYGWEKSEQRFVAIEQDEAVQSTAPATSSTCEQVEE